jgi:hypothetical protein
VLHWAIFAIYSPLRDVILPMDNITEKIKARKAMRAEYARLQLQLDKNRRIIYLGPACCACLLGSWLGTSLPTPRN